MIGERMANAARRMLSRTGAADLARHRGLVERAGRREQVWQSCADTELTSAAEHLRGHTRAFGRAELVEICALGREVARRELGERPYDVQLLGTLGLLSGDVVQMATGEGKTLSGALAAAAYALQGRRVQVISVNDYLARRDAEWMRPVYERLGVAVSWVDQHVARSERARAYAAEVVHVPVSEVGFDLLRDRLRTDPDGAVLGPPDVAIVDEADSVLVDEARVPLVVAGAVAPGDRDPRVDAVVSRLTAGEHYEIGEDLRTVHLTDAGLAEAERLLGADLYTAEHAALLSRVNVALYAHAVLRRDVDYLVRDGTVELIDDSRGRIARLQRWPDGLQAAVETKEGVAASDSGEVLDRTTVQSLIARYPTVCGMTGTAVAVAEQLREFYRLEVGTVPTHLPCVRVDEPDRLYPTGAERDRALVEHVSAVHATGRPVLLGTLDVAASERIAGLLRAEGMPCTVLNAKNDAEEAAIVAEAGRRGRITISTQMAGRGTDIRLGGPDGRGRDKVAALGGLAVIGVGRYHTSRLDDQLRGRAGRQGDPGGSVFFTSLEDELVTRHVPDAPAARALGEDGTVRDAGARHLVEHAQRVAEGQHLEAHRTTWRYNQLLDVQRETVLHTRERALDADRTVRRLGELCPQRHDELSRALDAQSLADAARQIVLHHLDRCWSEHLAFLTDLREGIHLRALAREHPLDAFQAEAVAAFKTFFETVRDRSMETYATVRVTACGLDLEASGLRRPTATWTYMVRDNPLGTPEQNFLTNLSRRFRERAR